MRFDLNNRNWGCFANCELRINLVESLRFCWFYLWISCHTLWSFINILSIVRDWDAVEGCSLSIVALIDIARLCKVLIPASSSLPSEVNKKYVPKREQRTGYFGDKNYCRLRWICNVARVAFIIGGAVGDEQQRSQATAADCLIRFAEHSSNYHDRLTLLQLHLHCIHLQQTTNLFRHYVQCVWLSACTYRQTLLLWAMAGWWSSVGIGGMHVHESLYS